MKTEYTTEEVQKIVQEETTRREREILKEAVIFTSMAGVAFLIGGIQAAFYSCLTILLTLVSVRIVTEILDRRGKTKGEIRREQA